MSNGHALLSPSAAARWMGCPGSLFMLRGKPDTSSRDADEGTAAHFLAAVCLARRHEAQDYIDTKIAVHPERGAEWWCDEDGSPVCGPLFPVDRDMATHVQAYLDLVRGYGELGTVFVEQRLPISNWTGEPEAHGTSDAVILTNDGELIVVDLKYGQGVLVAAENNKQLQLYALGAYDEFSLIGDITRVRLVIMQPRVSHQPQEWALLPEDLLAFGEAVKAQAELAMQMYHETNEQAVAAHLHPSSEVCLWCRAKATCPAATNYVQEQVGADFEDLDKYDVSDQAAQALHDGNLATKMAAVALIEDWCRAVRAEVERRLLAGTPVPGYKLVMGRQGNRSWADPTQAEAVLKSMRLKVEEMYDLKLISPTSAEKIFGHKGSTPSPRRWERLQPLITRTEGKPSVAPESDKRPRWSPVSVADDFPDETGGDLA